MENVIVKSRTENEIILNSKTIENLKSRKIKGSPDCTLLDLLIDFYEIYSCKIAGVVLVKDFIRLLQERGNKYAILYGNEIIACLEV